MIENKKIEQGKTIKEITEETPEEIIIFEDPIERPRSEYSMTVYKNLNVIYDYEIDADIMNIERTCSEEEKDFFKTADNEYENINRLNNDLNLLLSNPEKKQKNNKNLEKVIRKFILAYLTFSERCYDFLSMCGDDNVLEAEKIEKEITINDIKNEYFFNVYIMLEKLKKAVEVAKDVYKIVERENIRLYPNPNELIDKTAKLPYLFSSEPFDAYYDVDVFTDNPDETVYFGVEAFYRNTIQNDKYHARDEQLITFMQTLEKLSNEYYEEF